MYRIENAIHKRLFLVKGLTGFLSGKKPERDRYAFFTISGKRAIPPPFWWVENWVGIVL